MASLTGPDSALVQYRPVIEIADSKKFEDAVSLKTAGSYGPSEFSLDEIATIYTYIGDFLKMKGAHPDQAANLRAADGSFFGSSLREGESITITHN